MESDDESVKLKAIKEITDRVEGKPLGLKEDDGSSAHAHQLTVFFTGDKKPKLISNNGHPVLEHNSEEND